MKKLLLVLLSSLFLFVGCDNSSDNSSNEEVLTRKAGTALGVNDYEGIWLDSQNQEYTITSTTFTVLTEGVLMKGSLSVDSGLFSVTFEYMSIDGGTSWYTFAEMGADPFPPMKGKWIVSNDKQTLTIIPQ